MSSVSFVSIRGNTVDAMKRAIQESLESINYSFDKQIRSIVIKPNMCYYWDFSTGQTTDPRFVAALITLLRHKISPDIKIFIVESDASAMKCRYVFKMLGYEKLARDYNVGLVNLSQDQGQTVEVRVNGQNFHIVVPQVIQNADLKINIPKIKYASEEIKMTCALKNIFGCNPYPKKFRYHSRLASAIVAINKVMKFDLCLIDGYIVSGEHPRKLGLAMASEDPVAIDAGAAKIAGLNPRKIEYLLLAQKEGLGQLRFIPVGKSLHYFRERYPRVSARTKIVNRAYRLLTQSGLGSRIGMG